MSAPPLRRGFFVWEVDVSAFDKALDHVLRFEGGFVDHPLDPGGATNHGLARALEHPEVNK